MCARRQIGQGGKRGAEWDVDAHPGIDCPAATVQDRAKIAAFQLEPGQQHGGYGNRQHQAAHGQRNLPQLQAEYAADDGSDDSADSANRQSYRSKDTGELGDIERRFGWHVWRRNRIAATLHNRLDHLFLYCVGFGSGELLQLLADDLGYLLVGRPERLADADGVIGDAHNGGAPILPLAVVEHAVPSHHQKVRIACRECGSNIHLLCATVAHQFAIGQTYTAGVGVSSMRIHILDLDAQLATAAIQIERPGLENRLLFAGIKFAERYKVVCQAEQIALITNQALNRTDGLDLRFNRL